MATKIFCDLCKEEYPDTKFYAELAVRFMREIFVKDQTQPQVVEKHYHLCQKCLSDKLPGFDN